MRNIVPGALCYIIQNEQILLLRRNREPHLGRWTAPGGKMEEGESPQECVIREMQEETGLTIQNPVLRGIVTSVDVAFSLHWLLFIFSSNQITGELAPTVEGELRWIPLHEVFTYDMPHADRSYLPYVLENKGLFQLKAVYDTPQQLLSATFY